MTISIKEVEHVAVLARLQLKENEKEKYARHMGSVLQYVDKLNQMDTEGVEPLDHILPVFNVFRQIG
jgi:aspartyl-tRNA(Asn)/glutamyl-tRNA(Gln) amidotransferase subunit C